jgi:hypothetical protein
VLPHHCFSRLPFQPPSNVQTHRHVSSPSPFARRLPPQTGRVLAEQRRFGDLRNGRACSASRVCAHRRCRSGGRQEGGHEASGLCWRRRASSKRCPRNLSNSSADRNLSCCPVSTSSTNPSNRPSEGSVLDPSRTTNARSIQPRIGCFRSRGVSFPLNFRDACSHAVEPARVRLRERPRVRRGRQVTWRHGRLGGGTVPAL